jgi:hypothetical protein
MPTRMALFVTAMFTISLEMVSVNVRAADDCLTKPNAAAPQGSHWYYRVDRTTHRECWYLGPEGRKVRPQVERNVSPEESHPSKMSMQPAPQTPAKVITAEVVATQAMPKVAAPVEITSEPGTPQDNSAGTLPARSSDLSKQAASTDDGSALTRSSFAEEHSTTHSEDEMPLIWPVLTPADMPVTGRQPEFTVSFPQLGAFLAAMIGLATMVGRIIFKLSAACGPNRSRSRDRRGLTGRAGKEVTPTFAKPTAAARQANMTRKTGKVPSSNDPMVDYESGVRRLLHELQRRHNMKTSAVTANENLRELSG